MAKIKQILAREILNSKGIPTIETTVLLSDGKTGTASIPSGTSVGNYEASELRDGDDKHFLGKGVLKAISNIETIISPSILGMDATKQHQIDKKMIELDGTLNKGRIGANAILSVSIAVAKAAAKSALLPTFLYLREFVNKDNTVVKIPTPIFNILNGGKHAGDNADFQEYMIIPASSKTFSESLNMSVVLYDSLRKVLIENNLTTLVGDEGGFAPKLQTNRDGLDLLKRSIETTPFRYAFDVFLGLDVSATGFFQEGKYHIRDKTMPLSSEALIEYYEELNKEFHLLYLEDPLAEDDWNGWSKIYTAISSQTLIIGDDLTATNPYRLQMALDKKTITGIIIKPNQIGTVIEALAVVEVARQAGLKIIVSHRSGETNDDFIADFAVAVSADYVKFGAPARGERVAKYNRLLEIEKDMESL
ncbi:MAG: phosphopyruvate hydratase [Patescibacteria group bacterium]|nr:phosphopyruvate hydratase [Patescibacteria group bacterium]